MTDSEDNGSATALMTETMNKQKDLDAARAVDMAYRYLSHVRSLLDHHHGEGYAEGHTTIVAAMVQTAAQDRFAYVLQKFADERRISE